MLMFQTLKVEVELRLDFPSIYTNKFWHNLRDAKVGYKGKFEDILI